MSKITIPTEDWVELCSDLAEWYVEESALLDSPWQEDDEGNLSYTDDAQDRFNAASSAIEEILESFFVKGSWGEREDI